MSVFWQKREQRAQTIRAGLREQAVFSQRSFNSSLYKVIDIIRKSKIIHKSGSIRRQDMTQIKQASRKELVNERGRELEKMYG